MKRRNILLSGAALAGLAALPAAGLSSARAQSSGESKVRVLGDPAAPVTIKEYSSLTCPHCANFHAQTLPSIKKDWIDTGKAKLIYNHYPLDRLALIAGLSANCLESDRAFFAYIELLFQNQQTWSRSSNPVDELAKMAALAGLGRERFDQCINDEAEMDAVIAGMKVGRDTYNVQATPTLIVNEEKVEGAMDYNKFAKVLNEAYQGS
ncbi:DsbA family protein [Rhodovibrionaceae bacterium A322]